MGDTGPAFIKEASITPSIPAGSYEWADGQTGQRLRAQRRSMNVGANKQGTVVPVGQKRLSGPRGRGQWGQEGGALLRRFWTDVLSSGRKPLAWNCERRAGSGQICPLEKGWTLLCL